MGATAYQLFKQYDSEAVRVHALGTTAEGETVFSQGTFVALVESSAAGYCPGFNRATSDRIVPLTSQLANLGCGHFTFFNGAWHNAQDSLKKLQIAVVELLVDAPERMGDPLARFEDRFPKDANCFPLECGGATACQTAQCQ